MTGKNLYTRKTTTHTTQIAVRRAAVSVSVCSEALHSATHATQILLFWGLCSDSVAFV